MYINYIYSTHTLSHYIYYSALDQQENEDHVTDATVAASAEHEDTSTEIASAEHEDTSTEIAITVFGRNQKWTFHCDEYQPLATTLFIPLENLVGGRCFLYYDSVTMGKQLLDRTNTASFYGMIYDDIVYLGGITRPI